jgi:hypothetical protein
LTTQDSENRSIKELSFFTLKRRNAVNFSKIFQYFTKVQRHPAEPYEAVPGKEVILGSIVKTETLTDRLVKLLHALESVQASSVESERAFSCAGSFVTKFKNRMGDNTLDNYCFARHKLQMAKKLVLVV